MDEYGFDINSRPEFELRDPILWLDTIGTPTFVIEGSHGNIESLQEMAQSTQNPKLQFLSVPGADHFVVLSPATRLLADKVSHDTGAEPKLKLSPEELNAAVSR